MSVITIHSAVFELTTDTEKDTRTDTETDMETDMNMDMDMGGMLHTSTASLPIRFTTMGYTSMRYTSTALYFYKQFTQAHNKIFVKHLKQKICK
jgi:hypothetical protein